MPFTIANKITIVRILTVPFFIATVLYYSPDKDYLRFWSLFLFLFAIFSDAADGFVARKLKQETKIGALLDPLADKVLLISGFICLYKVAGVYHLEQFPIWLVVVVISRDMIILLGGLIIHLTHEELTVKPSILGKSSTVFQAACIVGILVFFKYNTVLWYITAFVSVVSLLDYIRNEIRVISND